MGKYDVQWRIYRWLRRISLYGFLGWILGMLLIGLLTGLDIPVPIPVLVLKAYLVIVFGAWVLLNFFLYPRCHWPFAITWWYSLSIFAWKCAHCDLRKFSNGDDEDE